MKPPPCISRLAVAFCLLLAGYDDQSIAADKGPPLAIITPPTANDHRKETARLLQSYIRKSTGEHLPCATDPQNARAIHVGRSTYVDGLGLGLERLDGDGFILKRIDPRNYVIAGPTEWGTEFGVCEFLERYIGVRWLLPGEHGTVVPRLIAAPFPPDEVRQEPAFFSRLLSGLRGEAQLEWARRNRMHGRVEFHHNLRRLFRPSRYAATHPEFYPVIDGRRRIPRDDNEHGWQPNFAADGIVEKAAENVKTFFQEHPAATSYSLGVNDRGGFDDSLAAFPGKRSRKNYFGFRHLSDVYFKWCNDVVTEVLAEFPDKYFGCLAYREVAEPPESLKLHPHLIPYLSYDRMMWVDPTLKRRGHELTSRWSQAAATIGWYDYAYGAAYCVPRVYPHLMAQTLRFGKAQGVKVHYAEAYPNWGEGPKLYVYLKLQWDPDLDVDALLADWYVACVGPAAATSLREYFEIWERFWADEVRDTDWFLKAQKKQYLRFNDPDYLVGVSEENIYRSRQLLDTCVIEARTEGQHKRAQMLRTAFTYYEASALAYLAKVRCRAALPATETEALRAVDDAAMRLALGDRRMDFVNQYRKDPVLDLHLKMERRSPLHTENWNIDVALWRLFDWMRQSEPVRSRLRSLMNRAPAAAAIRRAAPLLLQAADKAWPWVTANPSFERGSRASWSVDRRTCDSIQVSNQVSHNGGTYSLRFLEVDRSLAVQDVRTPLPPGHYFAVAHAFVPAAQPSTGMVTVRVDLRAKDGRLIRPSRREITLRPRPSQWTAVACPIEVPAVLEDKDLTGFKVQVIVEGFGGEGQMVYIDDVGLHKLEMTDSR